MNPPKMPIHIGDFLRDTGHLRAAGTGAYLLLMFHYWSTGKLPTDDEQLAAIARMTRQEWKKHRPTIEAFFKEGWKHGRIDFDLGKAAKISEAAREAGKASGRSRSAGQSVDVPLNDRSSSVEPTIEPLNHLTKEDTADAVSSKQYAFEEGIIRLTQKDFDKWKSAFSHLDLKAELISLSKWAGEQEDRWFHAVFGALNKRNREAKIRADKPHQPLSERDWREAIV